jgi:hypothetical protein
MKANWPEPRLQENFSLVVGGPLYQLYLRSRLLEPPVELVERRIIASTAVTWLPLLILTLMAGTALGGVNVPFLFDMDVHIRLLLALPLMIGTEVIVHRRISVAVDEFLVRGIIAPNDRARFNQIIATTLRWRNSAAVEILLLAFSTSLGYWIWRQDVSLHVGTWYYATGATGEQLAAAGWWYAFISLNLFRFMLLRWYFRLILWGVLLWRVSRLPLRLNALHPDRAGGLGFLAVSVQAFTPLLVAHSLAVTGAIANQIWHEGAKLPAFLHEIILVVVLLMMLVLLPLTFFVGALARSKFEGTVEYEVLAMKYADEFHAKWMRGKPPAEEQLVGSADIQSLADLGNAFEVVRGMRLLPLDRQALVALAVAIALPFVPLALTMVPVDELLARLATKIF